MAKKDGVWPTITYAYVRMRYGRGRCVIGTLSVVDWERVLLPRMRRRTALLAGAKRLNVQKCGGRAIKLSPLIRRKCHEALLWQLKWNFLRPKYPLMLTKFLWLIKLIPHSFVSFSTSFISKHLRLLSTNFFPSKSLLAILL